MRKDLNMRKGKMVAQGGHAVQKALLDINAKHVREYIHGPGRWTKICVGVNSLEELQEVVKEAKELKVPAGIVTDAGLTEFNNEPTDTCAFIGPFDEEIIDSITGDLKLL